MARGMSYQEAAQKVFISKLEEIGLDALGGALSGGIMGGGSVALNRLTTVHFSVPNKKASLAEAQAWVSDKFSMLNGSVNVKGLGTVTLDADSMTDAIHKTKTTDQAVAFAAIRDILRKGNVSKGELGTVALINTGATLNGNMHPVAVSVQKKIDGGWLVTGLSVDGELVYDASEYVQQKQNEVTAEGESLPKLVSRSDDADGGFDYQALSKISQGSGQQAPTSANSSAQMPAFEQQNSTTADGGAENSVTDLDVVDLSDDNELTTLINESDESKYTVIKRYILKLFGNKPVTLSDGRQAIVDGRDAEHIAHDAKGTKVAEISQLKKIFQKAKLIKNDFEVEHRKFSHFAYYEAKVRYGDEVLALVLNVGKAKNDGIYHIYELNHPKIRNTADRINGLSRPVGNAIANGVSNDSISNPNEIVKDDTGNSDPDILESRSYDYTESAENWTAENLNEGSTAEVESLDLIVSDIEETFDVPINKGNIRQKNAAGIFKTKVNAIRTQLGANSQCFDRLFLVSTRKSFLAKKHRRELKGTPDDLQAV